jgi:hypothetical protein
MAQGSRRGPRSSSHRAPPLTTSCELSLGSGLSPPPGWPSTPARSEDRSTSEILACDADFGSANPTDPQRLSAGCGGHGHRATGRSAGETAALQPRPRTHAGVNRPRRRRLAAQEEPDRLAGANGIPTPVVRQVLQHLHAAAGGRRRRVPLAPRGTGDPSTTITRTPAPSRVSPSVGAEAVWTITLVTTPDISSTAVSRRSSRSQLCSRVRTTVRARPAARASAGSDTRSVRMPQPVAALAARDGATWGS